MTSRREVLAWTAVTLAVGAAFIAAQFEVVAGTIRLHLGMIGTRIYEVRSRTGRWPAAVDDLEGTPYTQVRDWRELVNNGVYVVRWHQDLKPTPEDNSDRILAYDGASRLRFAGIMVLRGDLRIERMEAARLRAALAEDR